MDKQVNNKSELTIIVTRKKEKTTTEKVGAIIILEKKNKATKYASSFQFHTET